MVRSMIGGMIQRVVSPLLMIGPAEWTGLFFGAIVIVVFTWQGLNLVSDPKRWLIRHGRPTGEKHIRASRLIGCMFLAFVTLILLQLVRRFLKTW
jgi:hypothetical protein